MELYLQIGARMAAHSKVLFEDWGGGTAILSPRDLDPYQLHKLSAQLRETGAVLVDPQFYAPRSDYGRLVAHNYWPDEYETAAFASSGYKEMLDRLAALNQSVKASHFVVPGERAQRVDDLWLKSQQKYLEGALESTDLPLIATICLGADALLSETELPLIVEQAADMPVDGFYLVLERPHSAYFAENPTWLANALDLAAGLRRLKKDVIVAYSNQQQLIMACAAVTAIASGTWRNLRTFSTDRYRSDYARDYGHGPANWLYLPWALSEFKVEFLDIGVRTGAGKMYHSEALTGYAAPLFFTPLPSASGWKQADAFRHYLTALRDQVLAAVCDTFDETVAAHLAMLDKAERTLQSLHQNGVFGQERDFLKAIDANRSALTALEKTQGPVLRREWTTLL